MTLIAGCSNIKGRSFRNASIEDREVTSWVNHDLGGQRHWHSGVRYAPKAEAKSEYRHLPRWDLCGLMVSSGT